MSEDFHKLDLDPNKNYRRICFTINNPTFKDAEALWNLGHNDKYRKYLIYAAEHAEGGFDPDDGHPLTPHFQGFVVMKIMCRPKKLEELLGGRALMSEARSPSAQCANYCKKEHFYMEFGDLKGGAKTDLKPSEMRQLAIEWLDNEDNKYTRWIDIPAHLKMTPGFLTAWESNRKVLLGPDRPNLKIITVVGPTACGKSFAAHNLFPDHAKWLPGNGGAWFSNGDAPVLLFEEFCGQIELQKMLTLLDHYPLQLEHKGGADPALFNIVVITSNVTPDHWYGSWLKQAKLVEEARMRGIDPEEAQRKWEESKKALFDRIGFRSNKRGSGYYMEWKHSGVGDEMAETLQMRQEIWNWMEQVATAEQQQEEEQAAADIATIPATDEEEAAAAQPPAQLQRMDAEPDLFDWQQRIDSLF